LKRTTIRKRESALLRLNALDDADATKPRL
jgi:hypothetical protein